jgi:hypothetical protein
LQQISCWRIQSSVRRQSAKEFNHVASRSERDV